MAHVNGILDQLDGHLLSIRLVASTVQSRRIPPEKMNGLMKESAASTRPPASALYGRHWRFWGQMNRWKMKSGHCETLC